MVRRSVRLTLLATALSVIGATPALAVPQDVQAVQDGAYFRVSWTPQPGETKGTTAVVAATPDFTGTTCSSSEIAENASEPIGTLRVYCPIQFTDLVHIRLTIFGDVPFDFTRPASEFDFRPVGPQTSGTIRNRQVLRCRYSPTEWTNIGPGTELRLRIMNGSEVLAEQPFTPARMYVAYGNVRVIIVTGRLTGKTVRCEFHVRNGNYVSDVSVKSFRVLHALPPEMAPQRVLSEIIYPSFLARATAKRVKVHPADVRAGILSKAKYESSTNNRLLRTDLSIFSTRAKADRGLGSLSVFCSVMKQLAVEMSSRDVLVSRVSCGNARIANTRRSYVATLMFKGRSSRRIAVMRLHAATAGHGGFSVIYSAVGTVGTTTATRRHASKTALAVAKAVALGAVRE